MTIVSLIENDPGTLNRMTLPTRDLYDMMVDAHRQAAEVMGFHHSQFIAWCEAGKPVTAGPGGRTKADGYFVLTPMRSIEIERYLQEQYQRIKFIGTSYNEYIEMSYTEFQEYTTVQYRLSH